MFSSILYSVFKYGDKSILKKNSRKSIKTVDDFIDDELIKIDEFYY